MQEREGRECGLQVSYRIIDAGRLGLGVDDLPDLLDWAERLGFDGLNVTHPFKQAVLPLLDELSDDAADLGAVNTVVFRDGRRLGPQHRLVRLRRAPSAPRCPTPSATGSSWSAPAVPASPSATGCSTRAPSTSPSSTADAERADACAVRLAKRYGDDRVTRRHRPRPRARRGAGASSTRPRSA